MKRNLLITSIIIILISSLIINVSAENLTELSTNDLFIKYPYYLNNAETNDIISNATDTYNDVMSDYDENDEFISALKSGVSSSVEVIIRDLGSKLGLMDSYYETCMDTATIELMQTLYADENLIAGLEVVKKSSELLENVKTVSEITAVKSCEIAGHLENLSESQVLAMTEELVENSGEILESVEDAANIAKYIYIACIITDVELEMIDILMERVDKNGELYEGLSRLRKQMTNNIVTYTVLTFVKNKGLVHISEAVTKLGLSSLGISTGPFLIGQILAKTAVWVMFDVIYPHPGADEVISNMIHSMYVMELETALINQRLAFNSPFYVSDMDAYKTCFTVYLASIKTTLESTKALAKEEYIKQRLENAKHNLASTLPNYEAYINKCKNAVLNTAEADRIMRPVDQTMTISGTSVVNENGFVNNYGTIPQTDDGMIYWGLTVGGELTVNIPITFHTLILNGTLDVNSDITINGDFYNNGCLKMETDDAYVKVEGVYTQSISLGAVNYSRYITAGTLEFKGNINSRGYYRPSGTHKTVLSGETKQIVDMVNGSNSGYFNILEITNTSEEGVEFTDEVAVKKELYSANAKIINGKNIFICDSATIRNGLWNSDLSVKRNWECNTDCRITGNLVIGAALYLNANVTVGGNLNLNSTLENRGNVLTINGDFYNNGCLKMETDDAYVLVKGDYKHSGTSTYITAGTLEIKGDIIDSWEYTPKGTHRTVLSGDAEQSIDIMNTYSDSGYFNILELANTSEEGISFDGDARVYKEISHNGGKITNGRNVKLYYDATIREDILNMDITLCYWTDSSNVAFNGKVYYEGTNQFNYYHEIRELIPGGYSSDLRLYKNLHIKENYFLTSKATLELNNCSLIVDGNFENAGTLKMDNDKDYVLVKGYYKHSGTSIYITAGTLEIKGDIIDSWEYTPKGTHRTVLSGDDEQSIDIMNTYSDSGYFNILELANTSEEGISFVGDARVYNDILQPIGTKISNASVVRLQNKPAFVDYSELNAEINKFNGNAVNVIPTWLDYERYCKFALDGDEAFTLNETVRNTSFDCDLYFSNDYNESSAVVIIAFYDESNRFIQMASKPVEVIAGKVDVSIDYESKPYSTYKIMIWEGLSNLKPLMATIVQ